MNASSAKVSDRWCISFAHARQTVASIASTCALGKRTRSSQASNSAARVRLPAEFRFAGDDVFVTRDDATGDVVLSTRPGASAWGEFFELLRAFDVPADFMAERPLHVLPPERRVFDDERPAQLAGRYCTCWIPYAGDR